MAAKNAETAKPVAVRNFKDAGTGQSFEQGKPVDVDDGTLGNYRAAGLVGPLTDAQQIVDESHENAA
jgi:hypothetical protein